MTLWSYIPKIKIRAGKINDQRNTFITWIKVNIHHMNIQTIHLMNLIVPTHHNMHSNNLYPI